MSLREEKLLEVTILKAKQDIQETQGMYEAFI